MRKPTKKSITKKLQTKAENLWKAYCKARDKVCQICGNSNTVLQVHHIFSRKNKGLFLDVENGMLLCNKCHCKVTWDDAYKELVRRIKTQKDQATYDRLYEQSLDKTPFLEFKNITWLEEQIKILQDLLKNLEAI